MFSDVKSEPNNSNFDSGGLACRGTGICLCTSVDSRCTLCEVIFIKDTKALNRGENSLH